MIGHAVLETTAAPLRRAGATLLACLLMSTCGCDEIDRPDPPDPRVGAEEFLDAYLDAVAVRDTAALRSMYAGPDRLVWIEEGEVRYRSADEVFRSLDQFPPGASIETELEPPALAELSGGGVHAWGSFTTTVTGEGSSYSFGGLMSVVLEPTESGSWRIVGGHVSSPPSP